MPDDEQGGISDILNQDDIDSLLNQAISQPEDESAFFNTSAIILADGSRLDSSAKVNIESCDFSHPSFLGETEMRRLRLMHEEFVRLLEAKIALFLRADISLNMSKLETISYQQAISSIESPAHLCLFRASPLPGVGYLEISPRLALTITSSMMGGKGQAPKLDRYLTRIESDLIEEFLTIVLAGWCEQWQYDQALEQAILGHEVVGSVLQICDNDSIVLCFSLEMSLRGSAGKMVVSVPLYMIEPLVRHLKAKREQETSVATREKINIWRKGYSRVKVNLETEIQLGTATIAEALDWRPGTVLPLNAQAFEQAYLKVSGIKLFAGEAGTDDGTRAFRISGKYTPNQEDT